MAAAAASLMCAGLLLIGQLSSWFVIASAITSSAIKRELDQMEENHRSHDAGNGDNDAEMMASKYFFLLLFFFCCSACRVYTSEKGGRHRVEGDSVT